MLSREVKVLPVVDAEGRLLGIANRARLLQALLPPGVASA
jgi:CBS-domain-containing membrane protein